MPGMTTMSRSNTVLLVDEDTRSADHKTMFWRSPLTIAPKPLASLNSPLPRLRVRH